MCPKVVVEVQFGNKQFEQFFPAASPSAMPVVTKKELVGEFVGAQTSFYRMKRVEVGLTRPVVHCPLTT